MWVPSAKDLHLIGPRRCAFFVMVPALWNIFPPQKLDLIPPIPFDILKPFKPGDITSCGAAIELEIYLDDFIVEETILCLSTDCNFYVSYLLLWSFNLYLLFLYSCFLFILCCPVA